MKLTALLIVILMVFIAGCVGQSPTAEGNATPLGQPLYQGQTQQPVQLAKNLELGNGVFLYKTAGWDNSLAIQKAKEWRSDVKLNSLGLGSYGWYLIYVSPSTPEKYYRADVNPETEEVTGAVQDNTRYSITDIIVDWNCDIDGSLLEKTKLYVDVNRTSLDSIHLGNAGDSSSALGLSQYSPVISVIYDAGFYPDVLIYFDAKSCQHLKTEGNVDDRLVAISKTLFVLNKTNLPQGWTSLDYHHRSSPSWWFPSSVNSTGFEVGLEMDAWKSEYTELVDMEVYQFSSDDAASRYYESTKQTKSAGEIFDVSSVSDSCFGVMSVGYSNIVCKRGDKIFAVLSASSNEVALQFAKILDGKLV